MAAILRVNAQKSRGRGSIRGTKAGAGNRSARKSVAKSTRGSGGRRKEKKGQIARDARAQIMSIFTSKADATTPATYTSKARKKVKGKNKKKVGKKTMQSHVHAGDALVDVYNTQPGRIASALIPMSIIGYFISQYLFRKFQAIHQSSAEEEAMRFSFLRRAAAGTQDGAARASAKKKASEPVFLPFSNKDKEKSKAELSRDQMGDVVEAVKERDASVVAAAAMLNLMDGVASLAGEVLPVVSEAVTSAMTTSKAAKIEAAEEARKKRALDSIKTLKPSVQEDKDVTPVAQSDPELVASSKMASSEKQDTGKSKISREQPSIPEKKKREKKPASPPKPKAIKATYRRIEYTSPSTAEDSLKHGAAVDSMQGRLKSQWKSWKEAKWITKKSAKEERETKPEPYDFKATTLRQLEAKAWIAKWHAERSSADEVETLHDYDVKVSEATASLRDLEAMTSLSQMSSLFSAASSIIQEAGRNVSAGGIEEADAKVAAWKDIQHLSSSSSGSIKFSPVDRKIREEIDQKIDEVTQAWAHVSESRKAKALESIKTLKPSVQKTAKGQGGARGKKKEDKVQKQESHENRKASHSLLPHFGKSNIENPIAASEIVEIEIEEQKESRFDPLQELKEWLEA